MSDGVTEMVQDPNNSVLEEKPVTQEQFKTLMEQLEIKNKQVSSLDSKVSDYQKQLKEKEEAIEKVKTEGLTESERLKLEFDKLQMDFRNEQSSRTKADNKAKALEIMQENGIDKRYIDFVPLDDSEAMIERLNNLSVIAQDAVLQGAKSVVNKLGGSVPTGGNRPSGGIVTKEQIKTMSKAEINKAFVEGRIEGIGN